jgi:hypothetical protein
MEVFWLIISWLIPYAAHTVYGSRPVSHLGSNLRSNPGVADWWYEFLRGGSSATQKFIPGLSNALFSSNLLSCMMLAAQLLSENSFKNQHVRSVRFLG